MSDYTLRVRIDADASQLENQFKKAQDEIKRMNSSLQDAGKAMQDAGKKMTIGLTAPITLAGKKMWNAASDMQENLNKVNKTFGDSQSAILEWSKVATEKFGLSENAALEAAARFGDMGKSMGMNEAEAAAMAQQMASLAGDLSSFKNVDIDVAMNALTGVYTGETESMKSLGYVMTETQLKAYALSKGIEKPVEKMTQLEKVNLRAQYMMEAAGDAMGDYEDTSKDSANSMRTLKAEIENLVASVGQNLLPVITPYIHKMTELVQAFQTLAPEQQQMVLKVLAIVAAVGPALIVLGKLTSIIGGLTGVIGTVVTGIAKLVTTSGMFASVGASAQLGLLPIVGIAAGVVAAIGGIIFFITDLWNKSETFRTAVMEIWTNIGMIITDVWTNVIQPVVQAFMDILVSFWETVLVPLYERFSTTFANIASVVQEFFNFLQPMISVISSVLGDVLPPVLAVLQGVFEATFQAVSGVLSIFFDSVNTIIDSIRGVFQGLTDFISGVFAGNWGQAWQGVQNVFKSAFDGLIGIAKAPINAIINMVNMAIGGLNSIKVPDWVPGVGGMGINIPTIPNLYFGTNNWQGGFARMNEGGRGELTYLPSGSVVVPHDISRVYAKESARLHNNSAGAGNVYNQPITVRLENAQIHDTRDVADIARELGQYIQREVRFA